MPRLSTTEGCSARMGYSPGAHFTGSWCGYSTVMTFHLVWLLYLFHTILQHSQQNDIWQTQSWASMEWSGQWKLLHYFIRRTYNRVLVSPFYLDGSVCIYVVADVANYDISYDLQVDVIAWSTVWYMYYLPISIPWHNFSTITK